MRTLARSFLLPARLAAGVVIGLLCAACATVMPPSTVSTPPPRIGAESTLLARMSRSAIATHPGESGVYPLATGSQAFLARLVLADAAQSTLDLQYYLWNDDTTGQLMLDHAIAAADRGVRVRILLDDWGNGLDDDTLQVLAAHPNIHVRLFNPTTRGGLSTLANLLDYRRLSRRMHNKSMVADGHVAIVGGRNVGDEYFDAGDEFDYADLDVMAIGPVAGEVARQFDAYWDSQSSVPVASLLSEAAAEGSFAVLRARLAGSRDDLRASSYLAVVARDTLADELREGTVAWLWGTARALYDDPRKVLTEPGTGTGHVAGALAPEFRSARHEVILVSPYLVPGRAGVAFLSSLEERGVAVRVLTNSLATTDVIAAHAGYARHREAMLEAGIELYETRPASSRTRQRRHLVGLHEFGTSETGALHAKVYCLDRQAVFVGSFNFDPRSRQLNTELGVFIAIPMLAERLAAGFDEIAESLAWRVVRIPATIDQPARLEWVAKDGERDVRTAEEPGGDLWRQLRAFVMALLPIEDEL
jgi:putative cardiolipin synthase